MAIGMFSGLFNGLGVCKLKCSYAVVAETALMSGLLELDVSSLNLEKVLRRADRCLKKGQYSAVAVPDWPANNIGKKEWRIMRARLEIWASTLSIPVYLVAQETEVVFGEGRASLFPHPGLMDPFPFNYPKTWSGFFKSQTETLMEISHVLEGTEFLPPPDMVYEAFNRVPPDQVKVVLLGQDPYHGPGQGMGLAFSVRQEVALPPSLKNIYTELQSEGYTVPKNGDLSPWAGRGVLMINSALTVFPHQAGSHLELWAPFTATLIKYLNKMAEETPMVAILWGAQAQTLGSKLTNCLLVQSAHPSPFSAARGFFGSKPFSKANRLLKSVGREPINWNL